VPVASIDVSFECGGILLWSRWESEPDWAQMSPQERKAHFRRDEERVKYFDEVFPRWEACFRDRVGLEITTSYHRKRK